MTPGLFTGLAALIRAQGNLAWTHRAAGLLDEGQRRQLLADAARARTELDRVGLIFADDLDAAANVVRLADRRARR